MAVLVNPANATDPETTFERRGSRLPARWDCKSRSSTPSTGREIDAGLCNVCAPATRPPLRRPGYLFNTRRVQLANMGLQNVINNFVCGLILLFERPIKVGDVIEVGGKVGEVSRIGIRASVIRTADGSEVIVPNGSLISSQVTNWTFSDRRRAIEVSVNVTGGEDPQRVVELLKRTSASHPDVAKESRVPQFRIVNFSADAVTFQLRAWTDRHQDWAQVRSDLSIAINDTLARENIAIA